MDAIGRIVGSDKLEKTKVQRNLVGARSLEGLGTLGKLGLEGLLLFMYPNFILQWIIDRLEGRRRGFMPKTLVSSSITHRCVVFMFESFFPTFFPFILLLCYYEYGLE